MELSATDDPRLPVNDHPQQLGALTEVFGRRRVAAAVDVNGRLALVRPDSVRLRLPAGDERTERVASVVDGWDKEQAEEVRSGRRTSLNGWTDEVITVRLPTEPTELRAEPRWSVAPVLKRLAEFRKEAGVEGEVNHVLLGSQSFIGHPFGGAAQWLGDIAFPGAAYPSSKGPTTLLNTAQPAAPPRFLREPIGLGRDRPRVLVLDTGLRTANGEGTAIEHPELQNACFIHTDWLSNTTVGAADDEDECDDDGLGIVDYEAGHGTFIAGIVRQFCPDAEISIAGVLSSFGDGDVSTVVAALRRVLAVTEAPDVIVMSFGGFFTDDDPGSFADELKTLVGDAVVVAAAGNEMTCRPCFPAALPDVIAVGALSTTGRAWFSNFGPWVDACAPGTDVVSTYFNKVFEEVTGRTWDGWARWSGTSFSAPKVAAAIAQEKYLYDVTAAEAWKRLVSYQHLRVPDLGVVFNL